MATQVNEGQWGVADWLSPGIIIRAPLLEYVPQWRPISFYNCLHKVMKRNTHTQKKNQRRRIDSSNSEFRAEALVRHLYSMTNIPSYIQIRRVVN